ncbi:MAG: repeat protein [Bacteroidetes bacterium]|jgi:subtilisin-like proprotein convertase family protein|nr:repeat protein [Bacteroidota bacterium]
MKRILFLTLLLISIVNQILLAQPLLQRYDSIPVKINSAFITNPWAGGLNFAQNSEIDLNMDGIKDLFTFDRTGNKIRTYINGGTANTIDYRYDPSYESRFPEKLHEWCLLADYNNDGKEDIFTYSRIGGGFDIYKNISTVSGGLQFELSAIQQKSVFNPSRFNTTPAAIPDGGISSTWDGVSGPASGFASRPINVTTLIPGNWHMTSVCLNITHPNDEDLIVYLVNPCGNKIRLIKNAGGTGDDFSKTCFEPILTNVIGSVGNNSAPFSSAYAPEAGQAAWASFLSCSNPNGTWYLNVGDQTISNSGSVESWAITFYSPTTTFPNGLINLYVSSVDLPALSDIDSDGDLDVVTFSSTGTFIEYHQNMSMEFYNNADSLVYMLKNPCWGNATEDAMSNNYTLNINCPYTNVSNPGITEKNYEQKSFERHAGSCQLCLDLDNDGDKEYIVGDVSFSNLTMLTNSGTPRSANFTSVDTQFPMNNSSTIPVDLTLFPCAYYLDVNNDGLKDLIVTPNASGVNTTENFNSEVYYQNTGTNNFPVFDYQQSNILQDNMIEVGEGAYPVFFDYDNDGLKDLFIGNFGYYNNPSFEHKIAQFKNTGTSTNPKFELITRDYDGFDGTQSPLSSLNITNMVPAFGDMDADGDADMFIGGFDGKIHYFKNIAATGTTAKFILAQANYKNSNNRSIDVGDFAAPQIFDVDNDGKNDLVIGGLNGKLSYYRTTGISGTLPVLDSMTNFFGRIKVNQPGYFSGYSYPFMFRESGETKLISGSELGYLRLYERIDNNLNGTFDLIDSTLLGIREGSRTAPSGTDLNNDGLMDMIIGNYQGGVAFYKGVDSLTSVNNVEKANDWNLEIFPNPADHFFNIIISNDRHSNYRIELHNALGQLIFSKTTSEVSIDLNAEQLKRGIYICKVSELQSNRIISAPLTKRIVINHR